jgi:N-acetylglutamate synthase-like GNAT family acetyltransferase
VSERVILRPGRPDEIDIFQAIDQAARSRYGMLPGFSVPAQAAPMAAERFATGWIIVAEEAGRPVGFTLNQPFDGLMYLANIAVLPDVGGRGIGAELLQASIASAREAGCPAVTLATFKRPPWNGPWFRKHAFSPIPDDTIGPDLQAMLDRHAQFHDMTTRETLWHRIPL